MGERRVWGWYKSIHWVWVWAAVEDEGRIGRREEG